MSINKEEQARLFRENDTPVHVQAHCNEVARVAKKIAEALNEHGYALDVDLIYGAALVHDVLRVLKDHDLRGEELLIREGYPKEADLVRQHMKYYPFHPVESIEEIDVLCLADRVVRENAYVGIDKRMEYLMQKPNFPESMRPKIIEAREHARMLIQGIEKVIGCSFDELLTPAPGEENIRE